MPISWNKNLQWNTVDARGADGLLQYGRVIDCTVCSDEGLIIDFGGGKAPQQIPFGQIYRCKLDRFNVEGYRPTEDQPVDALVRLHRDEPATWYPGVFLAGDFTLFNRFALVRITTPHGPQVEVVPGERIRAQRSVGELEAFLLEKGQFVKEEIQLPDGVASGAPSPGSYETAAGDQRLLDRFNTNCSEHWMVATHIDGCVLHVLKITDRFRRRFDRDSRKSCPKLEGDTLFRMLGVTPQAPRKRPNDEQDALTKRVASSPYPALPSPVSAVVSPLGSPAHCPWASSPVWSLWASSAPTSTPSPIAVESVGKLPKEVVAEIFACLDGRQQDQLRRVCSTWNDMLTTLPVVRRVFRVPEGGPFGAMGPRVCLLKRWTIQTRIIVCSVTVKTGSIFDSDVDRFPEKPHYGNLQCTGRFFRCILQEKELQRLDKLLLGDLTWEWRGSYTQERFSDFVNYICTELSLFASVCHSLVLTKVTVVQGGTKTPVVIRFANARIDGVLSVDILWDWMDKSLPVLRKEDLACWSEWMSDNSDNDLPGRLAQILNERQSADPRDSNQFRGKTWTASDLANLDLEKLNRITAHSLLKTCNYEKLILVLHR